MGSWGSRSFDNDGAIDWLVELDSRGIRAVRSALRAVAWEPATAYLDIDDLHRAVAAAELVACGRGHGHRVPMAVDDWLDRNLDEITERDVVLARRTLMRARRACSELAGQADWESEVDELARRLARPPRARAPLKRKRPRHTPSSYKHGPDVISPDGQLSAAVVFGGESCSVWLRYNLADVVFVVHCDIDDIALSWRDDATLEIQYPGASHVVMHIEAWTQLDRAARCVSTPL